MLPLTAAHMPEHLFSTISEKHAEGENVEPKRDPGPWRDTVARTTSPAVYPLGPWNNTVPLKGLHLNPCVSLQKPSLRNWTSGNRSHYLLTLKDTSFLGTEGRKPPLLSRLNFLINLALILKWFNYFQQETKPPLQKSGQRWSIPHSRLPWEKPLKTQVSFSSQPTPRSTSNYIIQYS